MCIGAHARVHMHGRTCIWVVGAGWHVTTDGKEPGWTDRSTEAIALAKRMVELTFTLMV